MTSIDPGNKSSGVTNQPAPQQETDTLPVTVKAFGRKTKAAEEKKFKAISLFYMLRESHLGRKLRASYRLLQRLSKRRLKPAKKARSVMPEHQRKVRKPPRIKNLQKGEKLARGAFGSVSKATRQNQSHPGHTPDKLEKNYVVKTQPLYSKEDKEDVDLEIGLQKSIPFAPGVTGYGVTVVNGQECLTTIMEHRGTDLTQLIYGDQKDEPAPSVQPVNIALARSIARQFMEQLKFLHEECIAHRDIKPENLLVDHRGIVTTVDYGSARQEANALYSGKAGSPGYMAPEIVSDTPYTTTVDIWSSALVLYDLLTGSRPDELYTLRGPHFIFNREAYDQFIKKIDSHENLSSHAKDLIIHMLAVDPGKRLDAEEVLQHPFFAESVSIEQASYPELQALHIKAINDLAKYEQMKANIKARKAKPGTPPMEDVKREIRKLQDEVRSLQEAMNAKTK